MGDGRATEAEVRDPVIKHFKEKTGEHGLHVRSVFRPGPAVGFPDPTFYAYGRSLHIEFKRPDGEPSRKQEDKIARLRDLGHLVLIIDNADEGTTALDMLIEGTNVSNADEMERVVCQRAGTTYRALVKNCRKIEAW